MLAKLVNFSLNNRLLILLLFVMISALGLLRMSTLPVDAFPDTTPVQVQINTVAPALNPEEIEQQITLPVELSIGGLPGLVNVRSVSKFGFSQVVATFDDTRSLMPVNTFSNVATQWSYQTVSNARSWALSRPVLARYSTMSCARIIQTARWKSCERCMTG